MWFNNFFFFKNHVIYKIMWKNINKTRQVIDDNMVHVNCMLDT